MSTTTITTTQSQSLSDRLAAAKASVTENPVKTVLMVLFVIALLVGAGLLIRYFLNKRAADAATATAAAAAATAAAAAAATTATSTDAAAAATVNGSTAVAVPVNGGVVVATNGAKAPSASVAGITATTPAQAAAAMEKPQTVAALADNTVPWWQREFAKLPAMGVCEHGKYNPAPFPYDDRNMIYEAQAFNYLNEKDGYDGSEDLYAVAAMTRGDSASQIYARAKSNGIALLNRGAIRDPEKMLPRADPNSEYMRLFQVGASIADIQKNLPKTTDLMKLARERPGGLAFQIPAEKPPLYSEGINCERNARIPSRASDKNQLFCINPIDPRELYSYRPSVLQDSVLADGGRFPNGGGFTQDAPITSVSATDSASGSSQATAAAVAAM